MPRRRVGRKAKQGGIAARREKGVKPRMDPAEYALMDEAEDRMWWYRALHARLLDALARLLPERGVPNRAARLLDAGCGTGGLLAKLARERPDLALTGIEWNEAAAARARRKSGAEILRGSVGALPFATASFDAAISADVLCHRAVDPARALAEMARVLRPGGLLLVNMPAFAWLLSAHDRRVHNARRVTAGQLGDMLRRAGFQNVTARYWNGLLLPLMIVQRKLIARGDSVSDVAAYSPWLDATLHCVTEFERRARLPLPAGGSVLAVALR
jgi:SAM-dependent methyltransferase